MSIAYDSDRTDSTPPTPISEKEKASYGELVKRGGRPFYPIERHEEISGNLEAHRDFLYPWLEDMDLLGDERRIFGRQELDWRIFRVWQRSFREGFDARKERGSFLRKFINPPRDSFMQDFQFQDAGFDGYNEAIKKLLAEHGFTRPFRLEEDQHKQDKLTEWIEYLGFKHVLHDKDIRTMKLLQPTVDKGWKELVDSQVLLPHHTKEYVLSYDFPYKDIEMNRQAQNALEEAISKVQALTGSVDLDAPDPDVSPEALQQIQAARNKRDEAQGEINRLVEIRDRIGIFYNPDPIRRYRDAFNDLPVRKAQLAWILDQVPLIETEMGVAAVATTEPPIAGSKRRRGVHEDDSVTTNEKSPKKQRQNSEEPSPASDLKAGIVENRGEETPGSSRETGQKSSPVPAPSSPASASADQSPNAKTHSAVHSRRTTASRKSAKGRVTRDSVFFETLDTPSYIAPRAPARMRQPRRSRRIAGKAPEHGLLP